MGRQGDVAVFICKRHEQYPRGAGAVETLYGQEIRAGRVKPVILFLTGLLMLAAPVSAQDLTALARFDPEASQFSDRWRGSRIELSLSQAVPWRVFTLDKPRRLIADFREVDW